MRRLSAILGVWLGLLGVAMPALACSAGVEACCPVGKSLPCGTGSGLQATAPFSLCCSAGPTSTSALAVKPNRDVDSSLKFTTATLPAVSNSTADTPAAQPFFPYSLPVQRADASLTYLRTGRLRL
jgi:hypothetical protein